MYCNKCNREWGRFNCHFKDKEYHCPKCNEIVLISLTTITIVEAIEMPNEIIEYCTEHDYSTHCQNEILHIDNDNNVFARWLKKNGYKFKSDCDIIGIIGS